MDVESELARKQELLHISERWVPSKMAKGKQKSTNPKLTEQGYEQVYAGPASQT